MQITSIIKEDNMLTEWIRAWVTAGTEQTLRYRKRTANLSTVYVTNLICLIVSFFLFIQIPFYASSELINHQIKTALIVTHLLVLLFIPFINKRCLHLHASILFFCTYGSYIFLSSMLAGFNADTHLFFLLGLFVIPFIFPSHENRLKLLLSLFYVITFLLIEWQASSSFSLHQSSIKFINRALFASACFIAAYQIHRITATSWHKENKERQASDTLLSNILPNPIAKALRQSQQTIAQYHANVTILFADIEGFTQLSNQTEPMVLVNLLNELFTLFDDICTSYGLEKIKTLGDGYMAVSGLDVKQINSASAACACAKEMQHAFFSFATKHQLNQGIRIGLNTGPVVAGVIGKSKYSFDVWGDAVNLAARMQSHGEKDKIQVSNTTFVLTRHAFNFSTKRRLAIKGVGEMDAYWLRHELNAERLSAF